MHINQQFFKYAWNLNHLELWNSIIESTCKKWHGKDGNRKVKRHEKKNILSEIHFNRITKKWK